MTSIQDPDQLARGESSDALPELPLGPSVAGAYVNAAIHNAAYSPKSIHETPHNVRRHSVSRSVEIDMFDPSGVGELRRAMSRMSNVPSIHSHQSHPSSEGTLTHEGRFDLAKVLRDFLSE